MVAAKRDSDAPQPNDPMEPVAVAALVEVFRDAIRFTACLCAIRDQKPPSLVRDELKKRTQAIMAGHDVATYATAREKTAKLWRMLAEELEANG